MLKTFKDGQSLPVIKNIFHLTLVRNSGLAFGLFKGANQTIFIVSTILLIAVIISYFLYIRPGGFFMNIALGFVFAGAIGNLIDRIIRGRVIDFFDFRIWPVFNVADSAIVVGIISLTLVYTFTPLSKSHEHESV